MVVRRYVVKDMPEAVVMIRKDLGKEAVILSTRKVYVKKWMGIWRSRRIEVMAAAGGDVPVKRTSGSSSSHTAPARKNTTRTPQETFQPFTASTPIQSSSSDETKAAPVQDLTGEISTLVKEIKELKGFIANSVTSPKEVKHESTLKPGGEVLNLLLHELQDMGFSLAYASTLLETCMNPQLRSQFSLLSQSEMIQAAKENLAGALIEQLRALVRPEPLGKDTRVALFVGPTGVGKTTTIAKLAALHVLSGKKKVGFLTTDTFRVAAVEQLKTYAGILNVPIGIIRRDDDLTAIFHQQKDRDLILIDTTGRNYRDPVYVEEMTELREKIPVDETLLVLPMTGKTNDLYGLTKAFEPVQFDKFLFTKMDETSTFGAIIELLDTCRHPVSYVTTGQNVPDDLEVASIEKIVNRAFGKEAHV